jgi:hypothetical protein
MKEKQEIDQLVSMRVESFLRLLQLSIVFLWLFFFLLKATIIEVSAEVQRWVPQERKSGV